MTADTGHAPQPDLRRMILCIARQLGADRGQARAWYIGDPIAACGGATANQLVARGDGDKVVRFLFDAMCAEHRLR